ncbi:hypothetical protein GJ496_003350 [Pomphorhynchus laevis]|nr:hypothetical protein GJ496_003350 [Pomphorhynchus laevis]
MSGSGNNNQSTIGSMRTLSTPADYGLLISNRDLDSALYDPMIMSSVEVDALQNALGIFDSSKCNINNLQQCSSNGHVRASSVGSKLLAFYTIAKNSNRTNEQRADVFDKAAEHLEREDKIRYEKSIESVSDALKMKMLKQINKTEWMMPAFDIDSLANRLHLDRSQ